MYCARTGGSIVTVELADLFCWFVLPLYCEKTQKTGQGKCLVYGQQWKGFSMSVHGEHSLKNI